MGTFYLGLSMAGTVSAGTYTGGTLIEINSWLSEWQKAKVDGISLKVVKETANYKIHDVISLSKDEIPNHSVKIKSLSGASGGGVSAALFLAGLSSGNVEELLRDVWTKIDVREMLNNDELTKNKSIYSILNTKPIDDLKEELLNKKWNDYNFAKKIEYLDDNIEVFLTLASYEGIPFKTTPTAGNLKSYGIHKTHLDYIKFNFSKNATPAPIKVGLPFAYNLIFNKNQYFKDDPNWKQLFQSAPATAAFPFGFKPRSLKRYRKEYDGKLFYLDYTNPKDNFKYSSLIPAWPSTENNELPFEMEYVDGGTFNRDPHDLARASIIQSLGFDDSIPRDGKKASACVILIDPFPSNLDSQLKPGDVVKGIPNIFKQAGLLMGALVDQGRFRPDWIEKAMDENYYSRFLISPIRKDLSGNVQDLPLAGGLLGAFSGFLHKNFRDHDYKLGHYNTYQFLKAHFMIPINNIEIDYYRKANEDLKEKYEALGWYDTMTKHCQIIPRMVEPNLINSLQQPEWPSLSKDQWEEIYDLALERAKALADSATDFGWVIDRPTDLIIWQFLKEKVKKFLDEIEKELIKNNLLRK